MADSTVSLAVTALNALMAAVYILVGRIVLKRRPQGPGRLAANSFAAWWFALAFLQGGSLIDWGVSHTLGWSLPMFLAYLQGILLSIVVALAALMYYLVYLYTGKRGAWVPIAAGYTLYFVAILYFIAASQPAGLEYGPFGTDVVYDNDLSDSTFAQVLGLLLIVPIIVAALAYFSLFFKAPGRTQRFRIAVVANALVIWFGSSLVVGQTEFAEATAWRIVAPLIALAASLAIYLAFNPPTWLRQRLGIDGYGA